MITQNLAISRRIFDKVQLPFFRDEFGLTGGEDYDFFLRAQNAGALQIWCDDAIIDEFVSTDRLTTRSAFYREWTSGISIIMVDRYYFSKRHLWLGNIIGVGKSFAASFFYLLTARPNLAIRRLLGMVYFLGRVSWQMGIRAERYR